MLSMSLASLNLSELLSWRDVRSCQRSFLHLTRWSFVVFFFFFVFSLIMSWIAYYWFMCVKSFLHLWDEAYLIMVDDLFNMFWGLFCKYFLECFYIYVHKGDWSVILFLCRVFMLFGYQGNYDLIKWIGKCSFLFLFCGIIWWVLVLTLLWKSGRILH